MRRVYQTNFIDMTEDVYTKDQTAQLVFNAEIKKDIDTIKTSLGGIQQDLKVYAAQFVPNSLFIEYKKEVEGYKEDAKEAHDGFDKRIRFLEKYAWAAIGAVGFIEIAFEVWRSIHGA